jgi:hypothetical protein
MNRKLSMCGQVVNIPTDYIWNIVFYLASTDFMLCMTNEINTVSVAICNNSNEEM